MSNIKTKKTTKKSLTASIISMVACVALLIATTFAWFTSTASTSVNKIQAGTLEVALEMYDEEQSQWVSAEGKTLSFKKAAGGASEAVLWEPGCTYELPQLRVVNEGNLALQYEIQITGIQGDAKLNEAIEWTINNNKINLTKVTLAAETEGSPFIIKGHMKENAGNEYQGLSIDGISITVYATQFASEYDSTKKDYDKDADYGPDNLFFNAAVATQTLNTTGTTEIKSKVSASEEAPAIAISIPQGSVTLSDSQTQLTLSKAPTSTPSNIVVDEGTRTLTAEIKLTDGSGNKISANENSYFTLQMQLEKHISVQNFYHNGVALTKADSSTLTANDQFYYDPDTGILTFTTDDFSKFTATYEFAGGQGTAEYPYIIADVGDLNAIDNKYNKFNCYKVADWVETIDCSEKNYRIDLYGEFDGNGATFTNVRYGLFSAIGYHLSEETGVVKNLTAVMKNSEYGIAVIAASKVINFENVKVSGILEGSNNMGAFVSYGSSSANGVGGNYTLNFKNCSCDATIISKNSTYGAVLVGHTYEGAAYTATINLDSATEAGIKDAKIYAKKADGRKYFGTISNYNNLPVVYLDGVKLTFSDGGAVGQTHANAYALTSNAPFKNESGAYCLNVESTATSVKAEIGAQLTAYDKDGNAIAGLNGITMYIDSIDIGDILSGQVKLLDKIKSIEVINDNVSSGKSYILDEDGKLTVYTNRTQNYITGTIDIKVSQYNEDGALISSGSMDIAEKAAKDGSWVVK